MYVQCTYALVVIDYCSKYIYVYPMQNQAAQTVSECLMNVMLCRDAPKRLHSDQGRQFSRRFRNLAQDWE